MANTVVKERNYELRSTPGYTNYVVGTAKDISGVVGSSIYKRYYSDINAELYINGEWFEDIVSISWTVAQGTMPLYGYNSYIYDDVAQGSREIRGGFAINFTKPDILTEFIAAHKNNSTYAATKNGTSYEAKSIAENTNGTIIDGAATKIVENPAHDSIWTWRSNGVPKPRFDIDIVFGELENLRGTNILPNHIILWDCVLQSNGIGITADKGSLIESYNFLARDFKVIKS